MLSMSSNLLKKAKKKLFGKAYSSVYQDQMILPVARAFSQVLQARKMKTELVTAYTDTRLFGLTESFADMGFVWRRASHTFFGGDVNDKMHPYNPITDLNKLDFDVVFSVLDKKYSHSTQPSNSK